MVVLALDLQLQAEGQDYCCQSASAEVVDQDSEAEAGATGSVAQELVVGDFEERDSLELAALLGLAAVLQVVWDQVSMTLSSRTSR